MSIGELLSVVAKQGVELWVEGSRLRFRGPRGALSAELRAAIASQRDELVTALRAQAASRVRTSPLSHNQRALWFIAQEAPTSAAYHIAFSTRITTSLDPSAVRDALQGLTDRHAILRTTYHLSDDGEPVQRTVDSVDVSFDVHHVAGVSDGSLLDLVQRDHQRPFDLERGPIFRASLYVRAPDEHVLLLSVHHIAADGWSIGILLEDFWALLAEASGRPSSIAPRAEQDYMAFVAWQAELLAGPDGERLATYWTSQLKKPRIELEVPADRARPPRKTFRGATVSANVSSELVAGLRRVARDQATTLYVTLLAAFDAMLFRLTANEDLVVGTPTAGRTQGAFARVVGDFVNPVPIRIAVRAGMSFRELLETVRDTVHEALEHQDYPLSLIVQRLRPTRDASRSPLFETFFSLLRTLPLDDSSAAGGDAATPDRTPYPIPQGEGQFDLALMATERTETLDLAFRYNPDLFDATTVERFLADYVAILQGVTVNVHSPLETLSSADDSPLAYWRRRLAGLAQLTTFPPDRLRARDGASEGSTAAIRLAPDLVEGLRAMAHELGATAYMVLLAALSVVLSRRSGQTDLAIGSPLGTRDRPELESIIGPIVNPLVLRLSVADDPTIEQLVARAREAVLEGHAHQDVAFEAIVKELNLERPLGHSPLFQVALVVQNAPDAGRASIVGGGAMYDVTLLAVEHDQTLQLTFKYRTDLYDASTIERIANHFVCVLGAMVGGRGQRVSALGVLPPDEQALVVAAFNETGVDTDRASVVQQFARTASMRPDALAVVASDRSLTYRALDRVSQALARRLRAAGAGPGRFVALATDRGAALPAAAIGILKSGAAYVPVDLTYPSERVAFMLRDSNVTQIVTTRKMQASLDAVPSGATVIAIDDLWDESVAGSITDSGDELGGPDPQATAYLIYTSGSTGTPKGVLVPHSAVSNFLGAMRRTVGFSAEDVILSVTTPSFDISVLELFLPLVQGGRVVIADRDAVSDGNRLAQLLTASGATMLQSTPSGWRLLMNAQWAGNQALCAIVGGEPLPPALAEWLCPRVRALWNAYGPTETTVYSTAGLVVAGDPITIGRPIANTRVYVLDTHGLPTPIGTPGEMWIAGAGVATGYHGRPALTAERFVAAYDDPGAVMYRTGDIGRWRTDGRLEHLGRVDGQVKVRGHRIETGEIEAALESHEAVKEAVAGVHGASSDDPRLVAWVQLHEDQDSTGSELRRYLRQRLPEFMVPALIVPVDAFPLTPNGKTDRRALPDVFAAGRPSRTDDTPPTTPTERVIADIWMRLLGIDRLAVSDSFFELGGHSLLAMRAAAEITARTGRVVDPRLLFLRTLGQLAEACDAPPVAGANRP